MKIKLAVAILSIISTIAIFWGHTIYRNNYIFSIPILNGDKIDEIVRSKNYIGNKLDELNTSILFNGEAIPYDSNSDTYYISQRIDDSYWVGEITTDENVIMYFYDDDLPKDKLLAINENHKYRFIVIKEDSYIFGQMIVTGMPIISLTVETQIEDEMYGKVIIYDPDSSNTGRYSIIQSNCCFHIRGYSSSIFDKKPYKINLLDDAGHKNDISLLGMRKDDDWILNALYTDTSKIRDKLSVDLWNEINDMNEYIDASGSKMEYVEVFIDDEYMGLYGLMEPIDKKQLSLTINDILYKGRTWSIPTEQEFLDAKNSFFCSSLEVKHPNTIGETSLWDPIKNYIDTIYYAKRADREHVSQLIEDMNCIDYFHYIQLVAGVDNTYKNTYFVARKQENNYIVTKVPWDLNYTWGDVWINSGEYHYVAYSDEIITEILILSDYNKLLEIDNNNILRLSKKRWKELRKTVFNRNKIEMKMDQYMNYLVQSGAMQRESERWTEINNTSDLSQIKSFLEKRLIFLDEYNAS